MQPCGKKLESGPTRQLRKAASAPASAEEEEPKVETAQQKSSHHSTNRLGGTNVAPRALLQQRDEQQGLTPEMPGSYRKRKESQSGRGEDEALMNK